MRVGQENEDLDNYFDLNPEYRLVFFAIRECETFRILITPDRMYVLRPL